MTLLRLAATRTAAAGRIPFIVRPASLATTTHRFYGGPPVKVQHYESGWTADGVSDDIKSIEKYSTQTFNKISQVVSANNAVQCNAMQ